MTNRPTTPEMTLEAAVTLLTGGRLDAVIDTVREGVTRLSDAQVSDLAAAALRVRAVAEGLAFALTSEADTRGVVTSSTAAGTGQWVRERAAAAGVPVSGGVGQAFAEVSAATRSPGMAVVKDAASAGRISVSGARVVCREFRAMRGRIDPACYDPALEALVDYCAEGASGRQLAQVRDAVVSQYGLAGEFQDDCDTRAVRRNFSTFRRDAAGMYVSRVELDPASHAVVEAAITALAAPTPAEGGFADVRSAGQRRADALVEVCSVVATDPDLLDRSAHTPQNASPGRAARARVVVTMPWQWLTQQTGYGRTGFDQPLAPGDVRRMACDAQIIPTVLGSKSQPLDVGRASRLATPAQRIALAERDRGCTFPGCDRPPSWCEAHHLDTWETGGNSDLGNFALLCGRHHTIVHRDRLVGVVEAPPPTGPPDGPSSTPPTGEATGASPAGHDASGERGWRVTWHPPASAGASSTPRTLNQ